MNKTKRILIRYPDPTTAEEKTATISVPLVKALRPYESVYLAMNDWCLENNYPFRGQMKWEWIPEEADGK